MLHPKKQTSAIASGIEFNRLAVLNRSTSILRTFGFDLVKSLPLIHWNPFATETRVYSWQANSIHHGRLGHRCTQISTDQCAIRVRHPPFHQSVSGKAQAAGSSQITTRSVSEGSVLSSVVGSSLMRLVMTQTSNSPYNGSSNGVGQRTCSPAACR